MKTRICKQTFRDETGKVFPIYYVQRKVTKTKGWFKKKTYEEWEDCDYVDVSDGNIIYKRYEVNTLKKAKELKRNLSQPTTGWFTHEVIN